MTRMRAIAATALLALLAAFVVLPATAASAVEAANVPTVSTEPASDLTTTSAFLNANVNPNGSETTLGFEWGPTTDYGNYTHFDSVGDGTTSISAKTQISGLSSNTIYHFRAIADDINNDIFGSDVSFTTAGGPPTVTTQAATSVGNTVASLHGIADPHGVMATTAFEYGTTAAYGTIVNLGATGPDSTTIGEGIDGLTPGTTYHYRLEATSQYGTTNGNDVTFTTTGTPPAVGPTVATQPATAITSTTATLNASVNPNGNSTSFYFEYGTTTNYIDASSSSNAGSGSTAVPVSRNITGLTAGTTYFYRIIGLSSAGAPNGADLSFTTIAATPPPATKPTAVTQAATGVDKSSATLNGAVNPNGSATSYAFEYGKTTGYGTSTATASAGAGQTQITVTAGLSGLPAGTTYHYRIVATNAGGTSYGDDRTFTTAVAQQQPTKGGHGPQYPPNKPCPVVQPPSHQAPPAPPVFKPKPPLILTIIWKFLSGGRH